MLVGEKKTLGRVPPSGKQIRVYLLFSKKKKYYTSILFRCFKFKFSYLLVRGNYNVAFNIELAFNIYKLERTVSSLKKKEAKREDKISEITKHIKDVIEKFRPIKYP